MEQYINNAVEQFKALLNEQLKRVENMEKGAVPKDYSNCEKITIGIIGGDGIGPIIVDQAKELIAFLLKEEVESGRVVFNVIDGSSH